MTVAELITRLQELPGDLPVGYLDFESGFELIESAEVCTPLTPTYPEPPEYVALLC